MPIFLRAQPFDLSALRAALKYATFSDVRVHDCVNFTIEALEHDLDEVGFEPSDSTIEAIGALSNTIRETETGI